jgi:hypothetical protein
MLAARFIDADIANVFYATANTAILAEFAGLLAAESFISNEGHNNGIRLVVC